MMRGKLTDERKKEILSTVQSVVTELSLIGNTLKDITEKRETVDSLVDFFTWAVETDVVSEGAVESLVVLITHIKEGVIKAVEIMNSILKALAGEEFTPTIFVRPPEDIIHKQRK